MAILYLIEMTNADESTTNIIMDCACDGEGRKTLWEFETDHMTKSLLVGTTVTISDTNRKKLDERLSEIGT